MRNTILKLFRMLFYFLLLSIGLIFVAQLLIKQTTKSKIYEDVQSLPHNKVGLVLGTIKILPNGRPNLYFRYRIEKAVELFRAGKVDYLLLSGDNSRRGYNEPEDMQAALLEKGIPADRIYLDYAGFRTLDSVVRCKEVFGQEKVTIVSQEFHNARALYIAQHNGLDAIAINARNVTHSLGARYHMGLKVRIREAMARVKMLLDLYLLNKQPKFLGEKTVIGSE